MNRQKYMYFEVGLSLLWLPLSFLGMEVQDDRAIQFHAVNLIELG